jgi:3-deoxy-manno-octulosonate cytidylyltransferase (CMP-KDO synthetase)
MSVALIIPGRLNSQRLLKKMLETIGNQTLIEHVVDRALESEISDIILATDSEQIVDAVSRKNVKCVMTRSEHQSGTDRIYEALTAVDPKASKFDFVINLQGDMPFIQPNLINLLAEKIKSSKHGIATLVAAISDQDKIHNTSFVKAALSFFNDLKDRGRAVYFSRQPVPHNAESYYEHIGIYAYTRSALEQFVSSPQSSLEKQEKLEQLRAYQLGLSIEAYVVDGAPISVDTADDLARARAYYQEEFCKTEA